MMITMIMPKKTKSTAETPRETKPGTVACLYTFSSAKSWFSLAGLAMCLVVGSAVICTVVVAMDSLDSPVGVPFPIFGLLLEEVAAVTSSDVLTSIGEGFVEEMVIVSLVMMASSSAVVPASFGGWLVVELVMGVTCTVDGENVILELS